MTGAPAHSAPGRGAPFRAEPRREPRRDLLSSALHLRAGTAPCSGVVQDALLTAERGLERLYRQDGARLWRALVAFSGDREVASDRPMAGPFHGIQG